ncbi:MAG: GlsB/YeaQ/YmgE family stress response membrane protein [Chloroflexota bacterium]|jgi:uncharacterized membrane protein YeaQ/YmgE (transglycosylase-associated protein family)
MDLQSLFIFIVFGLVIGWLAGQIMKGRSYGVFGNIIIGTLGSVLGGWLFGLLNISVGGLLGQFVVALMGAIFLLFFFRQIFK